MTTSGLFSAKGRVLVRIVERPGTTNKGLARDLCLTVRTISFTVGELLADRYVTATLEHKLPGETGRKEFHYRISPQGLLELGRITEHD